jgi:hypothetical protein
MLNAAVANEFKLLVQKEFVDVISRTSGFIKRKSKLDGISFANLFAFGDSQLATSSLLDLCHELNFTHGISISKQSLDERFNDSAVKFLKQLLEETFKKHIESDKYKELLPCCESIRIKDATSFELPEEFREYYRGSGGKSSKSCVKIQFEFDLKTGNVLDLSLGHYTRTDLTDSNETIDSIKGKDLLIRDLGYIGLEYLSGIEARNAFYLNRVKSNVSIWIKKKEDCFELIDFSRIEDQMRRQGIRNKELEVFLGLDKRVKTRLIIECLPDEIKAEKLRKAHQAAKREGRELGIQTIARIGLNLFVTNLSKDELDSKLAWNLYRLRWQIELVFKTWKSVVGINKIKKVKRQRLECYLYGKLLWVILGWKIYWRISLIHRKKDISISIFKFIKSFQLFCKIIKSQLKTRFSRARFLINDFVGNIFSKCQLEIKKGNLSSIDIIVRLSVK